MKLLKKGIDWTLREGVEKTKYLDGRKNTMQLISTVNDGHHQAYSGMFFHNRFSYFTRLHIINYVLPNV